MGNIEHDEVTNEELRLRRVAEKTAENCDWWIKRAGELEAERDAARDQLAGAIEAMERAHEQLSKFGVKGPKQVGRAMLTLERALGTYKT
jgi:hypothetical protein